MADANAPPGRGLTLREAARLLRVGRAKVATWVKSGQLGALNTSAHGCGKPRFVILPSHLEEFARSRAAAPPQPAKRKKKMTLVEDYFQ